MKLALVVGGSLCVSVFLGSRSAAAASRSPAGNPKEGEVVGTCEGGGRMFADGEGGTYCECICGPVACYVEDGFGGCALSDGTPEDGSGSGSGGGSGGGGGGGGRDVDWDAVASEEECNRLGGTWETESRVGCVTGFLGTISSCAACAGTPFKWSCFGCLGSLIGTGISCSGTCKPKRSSL